MLCHEIFQKSLLVLWFALVVPGCMSAIQAAPESFPKEGSVAFGRVKVLLTGPTARWYLPEIRFIELHNHTIDARFRLDIESDESMFAFSLPEGDYQITRVQIREGGFRGMAELTTSFHIDSEKVNYLGTWTFVVAPPYYDRGLVMTVSSDMIETLAEAYVTYKDLQSRSIITNLAHPEKFETRLFEITPYPRIRWFQRRATSS